MDDFKNNLILINFHFRLKWPPIWWGYHGHIHREVSATGQEAHLPVTRLRMSETITSSPKHVYMAQSLIQQKANFTFFFNCSKIPQTLENSHKLLWKPQSKLLHFICLKESSCGFNSGEIWFSQRPSVRDCHEWRMHFKRSVMLHISHRSSIKYTQSV
jgi:hypothetical protein